MAGLCPANRPEPRAAIILLHPLKPPLLQKLAMPFLTLKPTIVLPGFAQSFPADKTTPLNSIPAFLIKL
jgi:hypothetical protein